MLIETIAKDEDIVSVSALALIEHERHLASVPWLPARSRADFEARIGWMAREGTVLAVRDGREIQAFLGGFPIENFRNEGPGAYSPDWCMGFSGGIDARRATRDLIRAFLSYADGEGLSIHAASVRDSRPEVREEFFLSGYGAIVLDLARPTGELLRDLDSRMKGRDEVGAGLARVAVRRACASDAESLSGLDGALAAHIRSAPPLMPGAHGSNADEWLEWLAKPGACAFLAVEGDRPIAFMKAEDPQFDVSYSVHGPATFAIDGLYVDPSCRGRGVARTLLRAIAAEAASRGKTLTSVDCETMNPEAYGFWTGWFTPLSWSLERRWGSA